MSPTILSHARVCDSQVWCFFCFVKYVQISVRENNQMLQFGNPHPKNNNNKKNVVKLNPGWENKTSQ